MLDIFIIIFLLFGFIVGYKRGVIKQSVITIGLLFVFVLSFALKNPVSAIMYKNLPFFTFYGLLEDISVLNILLYELVAFCLVFSILSLIFLLTVRLSTLLEKVIKASIILALPSKILGGVLGLIEYYIISFIILFILVQPIFDLNDNYIFSKSKLKEYILNNSPLISGITEKSLNTVYEISDIIKEENDDLNVNCKTIEIMKKNNIITDESLNYLYDNNKLKKKCEEK